MTTCGHRDWTPPPCHGYKDDCLPVMRGMASRRGHRIASFNERSLEPVAVPVPREGLRADRCRLAAGSGCRARAPWVGLQLFGRLRVRRPNVRKHALEARHFRGRQCELFVVDPKRKAHAVIEQPHAGIAYPRQAMNALRRPTERGSWWSGRPASDPCNLILGRVTWVVALLRSTAEIRALLARLVFHRSGFPSHVAGHNGAEHTNLLRLPKLLIEPAVA